MDSKEKIIKEHNIDFRNGCNSAIVSIHDIKEWMESYANYVAAQREAERWFYCSDKLPDNTQNVLGTDGVHFFICNYTKGHEIPYEDFNAEDDAYDEIEANAGTLFLKAGWYECVEQQSGEYDEIWQHRKIIKWMPLPLLSTPPTT